MAEPLLDDLAEAYGIALSYVSEAEDIRLASDAAKRGLLRALGVRVDDDAAMRAALAEVPRQAEALVAARSVMRAYMPGWLREGRAWGITCQLYSLRSGRNWGMGDFEDLAQLAELAAGFGADFLGVNPLHALFLSEPSRYSPYSPSSRRFLNPLYIAVDKLEGAPSPDEAHLRNARDAELVDYASVAALKAAALEKAFAEFRSHAGTGSCLESEFERFRDAQGDALADFALFEALSEKLRRENFSAGWHGWPEEFKDKGSEEVRDFRSEHSERVLFHAWLQWLADRQLAEAQRRALAAGMRIGLYLDIAVGAAPDGADTWSAPRKVIAGARIGAPPDPFNADGQDWGLAPLSPKPMQEGDTDVFGAVVRAGVRHAGAIRLDHAMALVRLYLIPEGCRSQDGAYIRYPLDVLINVVAEASMDAKAIVIGEDLGTVPPGFRDKLCEAEIQGYRVLFFERDKNGYVAPSRYDRAALACVSTHDLPTLSGWWRGRDISERAAIGLLRPDAVASARKERKADRRALISALADEGLLPPPLQRLSRPRAVLPEKLPQDLAVATHRLLARTPCRLVAVQLEDLVGSEACVNIPGTVDQHPNWRRKLPLELDSLPGFPLLQALTTAMKEVRPRTP